VRRERQPAFGTDPQTLRYYDQRALEYDDWYLGTGLFAERDRPGWHEELESLRELLRALDPAPTIDVACGTAYLSRHLRGPVVGLDRSDAMVRLARSRLAVVAVADALHLPARPRAVARVFTAHFYGHLPPGERARFLAEVRRIACELVVVDTASRPDLPSELWQRRVLNDGSAHRVFKRFLDAGQLAGEIGGSVLFEGSWFVAARAGHPAEGARRQRVVPDSASASSASAMDVGTTRAPTAL
jgi:SAM-dependent methyltransferase